ncbi:uncharacterized protein LAJ45_09542 [Morchella importuna]|uniref:uncharacterized protein n=1 Tax=Morchella importuna TaxID=1174673 RepID=UPI001E8D754C|nr:uncharacterized protein LAJ45_09542 [Morchella importuna]KAH8146349.1 hypothetical protein LAJ45_09542 [Morchella importuna]
MTPFLSNLLLFSPLLAIAALILYVLDRAENLRRGAGLIPDPAPAPLPTPEEAETEAEKEAAAEEEEEEEEEEGPPELIDPSDTASNHSSNPDLQTPPHGHLYPDEDAPELQGAPTDPVFPNPAFAPAPRTRTVGTKKARSLASRDQRRAYHEFLRSQQEERARAAAATAADDEERVFAEKRRRALVEEEIDERVKMQRAQRATEERAAAERYRRDVERLKGFVAGDGEGEGRAWELAALAGKVGRSVEWVRGVLRAEGLVGMRGACGGC